MDSETDSPGPINPHLFRGYSVRGIADDDLPDDVVLCIGQAIGGFFRESGAQTLVLGRDVRVSSPRISRALIPGLVEAGLHVVDVGCVPTPVHNFATDLFEADAGVMVTASHNPPAYNGLKIRSNRSSLRAEDLQTLYHQAVRLFSSPESPNQALSTSERSFESVNPLPNYVEHVMAYADLARPLTVVVDGGNGANGPVVSHLLGELGCRVIEVHCRPDGTFPNRSPDPTAPDATESLSAVVLASGAHLGLAYDGDGDRLVVVDDRGQTLLGDRILMLLARDVLSHGPAKIVYEILCSKAVPDDITAHGGQPIMTPNGYAFVHQAVLDEEAALGGELSGHLFLNQPLFRFDDPILATVKLLNILSHAGAPLSDLAADLPAYFSSPPIRLDCPDTIKTRVVEQIKEQFQPDWPVDELDGVRIDFGDGWALVRASNTQPALSLRFEASSEARLSELMGLVMEQVDYWMHVLSTERPT